MTCLGVVGKICGLMTLKGDIRDNTTGCVKDTSSLQSDEYEKVDFFQN